VERWESKEVELQELRKMGMESYQPPQQAAEPE
jgi:hypothetical protein